MNFATESHHARKKKKLCRIDMAPLVDIIFLLLIFFMLGSDFTKPSLALDLPRAASAGETQTAGIRISVDRDAVIFVNKRVTSLESLASEVKQQLVAASNKTVVFSGDKGISYELFVKILAIVNGTGAGNFSVELEKERDHVCRK